MFRLVFRQILDIFVYLDKYLLNLQKGWRNFNISLQSGSVFHCKKEIKNRDWANFPSRNQFSGMVFSEKKTSLGAIWWNLCNMPTSFLKNLKWTHFHKVAIMTRKERIHEAYFYKERGHGRALASTNGSAVNQAWDYSLCFEKTMGCQWRKGTGRRQRWN